MDSLFPISPLYPPGFIYQREFLTVEEEQQLLEDIKKTALHTFVFQGYEAKRKVASFGYNYSFDKRSLSPGDPILRAICG